MTHWAADYIGNPWDAAENHCWAFCRRVWREHFGVEVPEVLVDGASPRAGMRAFGQGQPGWTQVAVANEGDGVLMARGDRVCHVGIWIAAGTGGVLHAIESTGTVFTPVARLASLGYRVTGFYRRVSDVRQADAGSPQGG